LQDEFLLRTEEGVEATVVVHFKHFAVKIVSL